MKASTIARQMAYCQAIIDRPTTSPSERKAAELAMERLAAKRQHAEPSFTWAPRWQGSKYLATKGVYGADLNKLIRAEITLSRKLGKIKGAPGSAAVPDLIGDAPEQIKITVRSPHYGSITITVRNVPQDWGYTTRPDGIGGGTHQGASDNLLRLGIALRALAGEYNYDDSNAMVDYFDTRFYLSVQDETGHGIDRDWWRTIADAEYDARYAAEVA